MVLVKRTKKRGRNLTHYHVLLLLLIIYIVVNLVGFSTSLNQKNDIEHQLGNGSLRSQLGDSIQSLKKKLTKVDAVSQGSTGSIFKVRESSIQEKNQKEVDVGKENPFIDKIGEIENEKTVEKTFHDNAFFFADYSSDRENPSFRFDSIEGWDGSQEIILADKPLALSSSIGSCQYKSADHSILIHSSKCLVNDSKLLAFNPSDTFERILCGMKVPPRKAVVIDKSCNISESVRLFPQDSPPIDGKGMPPIVVKSSHDSNSNDLVDITCDISCKHEAGMKGPFRYIEGTKWKISLSIRDPIHDKNAEVERTSFLEDLYYSTTSFKSSIPLSYFSFDEYNIFTPALDFNKVNASGTYFLNKKCNSQFTKRHRWAEAVLAQVWVNNYGSCAHNADPPDGLKVNDAADRIKLMKKHRFNLAFQFGDRKDHITPMIWEAFSAGTLPIVIGAQNMQEHFPFDSFVSTSGLQHYGDLGYKVEKIVNNKDEWEKYHKWRTDPKAKKRFYERYNFTRISPECRMCRWAYAKKYGLGWSHVHQYVHNTGIKRNLCLDESKNLIARPFRESWHTIASDNHDFTTDIMIGADPSMCVETSSSRLEYKNDFTFTRVVKFHDNVIDIDLSNFNEMSPGRDVIIRLELAIQNFQASAFPNPHTLVNTLRGASVSSIAIQDKKSKVITIANWITKITCTDEGIINVVVREADEKWLHGDDERRKIRVIIEDMVELYDKSTEFYPTSFAKLMIQDFVDPLEFQHYTCVGWVRFGRSVRRVDFPTLVTTCPSRDYQI